MLRDPVQRTISWYSHVRRECDAYRHDRVVNEDWSLLDFVTDEETNWDMVNAQTLFLAADLDYDKLATDPVGYGQAAIKAYASRANDRELLSRAKARLEQCAFFGLAERMRDSLRLLCHSLNFYPLIEEKKLNVSANRPSSGTVSADALEAINRINALDRELYDWASHLFEARYSAMVDSLLMREWRESHKQRGDARNAPAAWLAPLAAEDRASIEITAVDAPPHVQPQSAFDANVVVANHSKFRLASHAPHPVHLSYHWIDAQTGNVVIFDGERTALTQTLDAGGCAHQNIRVRAPGDAGAYVLRMTMVQEGVAWFDDAPACAYADYPVEVD